MVMVMVMVMVNLAEPPNAAQCMARRWRRTMGTALEMAVMAISMKAVCIMWGVYSDCSIPKMKGGWMTRVTPVKTRQRVSSSNTPQASFRKMQERRDTQTGRIEAIIVTSAMGRYLKSNKTQKTFNQRDLTA